MASRTRPPSGPILGLDGVEQLEDLGRQADDEVPSSVGGRHSPMLAPGRGQMVVGRRVSAC